MMNVPEDKGKGKGQHICHFVAGSRQKMELLYSRGENKGLWSVNMS